MSNEQCNKVKLYNEGKARVHISKHTHKVMVVNKKAKVVLISNVKYVAKRDVCGIWWAEKISENTKTIPLHSLHLQNKKTLMSDFISNSALCD